MSPGLGRSAGAASFSLGGSGLFTAPKRITWFIYNVIKPFAGVSIKPAKANDIPVLSSQDLLSPTVLTVHRKSCLISD